MTPIHKIRLPHHRRYIIHRRIGIDAHIGARRSGWLVLIGVVLGLLIAAGEEYALEYNLRLLRENEIRDLLAAHLKPRMGAPGTQPSDWKEGTWKMEK